MSGDRRQIDRRTGEKDRRKSDRRGNPDKKTLTMTLTTFVTVVIVVIIIFITTLAFMAVYFERKLNTLENSNNNTPQLEYSNDEPTDYIDISNIIDNPNLINENLNTNTSENNPIE